MNTIKEQFEAAVSVVKSVDKSGGTFQPSTTMMLTFYAFYKQSVQGTCNTSRPAFYDVVGRAKWDAWKQLGNMSSEKAMKEYVNELKKIIEVMPQTEVVQNFVGKLGNFYEMVDDIDAASSSSSSKHGIGPAVVQSDGSDHDDLRSKSEGGDELASTVDTCLKQDVEEGESVYLNGFLSKQPTHLNGKITSFEVKVNGFDDDGISEESEEEGDDDGDEEEDDDDHEKCSSNNNIINTKGSISSDGDDEFCDTIDTPFHQEEVHYFRSSSRVPDVCRKNVTFQKDELGKNDLRADVLVKINKLVDDDVLLKIHKAIHDLQRSVNQLERDVKGLHAKQVEIVKVFDFLYKFRVPGICLVVLWPVLVSILFAKFSRVHRGGR